MKLNKEIFIKDNNKLKDYFQFILDNLKNYCDEAEISISTLNGMQVSTKNNEIENLELCNSNFFKIVIYKNGHMGSASSTNLNEKNVIHIIKSSIEIAKYTNKDNCFKTTDDDLLAKNPPDLNLFYDFNIEINTAAKIAGIAEVSALKTDKKIKHIENSSFHSYYKIKMFGNTKGMLESYCSSKHSISISVIAEKNKYMEKDYSYSIARKISDLTKADELGKQAAQKAIAKLIPTKLSTMRSPVIFLSEIANSLFKHLAEAINGFNIYNKSSFLLNSLGKKIFPSWLTIFENPHVISGLYSAPFDEEGVLTKPNNIINQGILENWLLNNYSSRKLGLKSNGHSGGFYNWYFICEKISFNNLLKKIHNGFLVTELMGNGVNIITGDYSRGASGMWIENGKISFPVSEVTISGNLKNMWLNMIAMSDDIEKKSSIQCGSLLLPEMCISGN